jgi:3-oxoacyl-[acyl-carrier protein] reductase
MLLAGKTALITGASSGCGSTIARYFAKHGATVIVNYFSNRTSACNVVSDIKKEGGHAFEIGADITDELQCINMFKQAKLETGNNVDILVNNAFPGFQGGKVGEATWQKYVTSFETIIHGTVNTCKVAIPSMVDNKFGKIINIGSTSIYNFNEGHAPYIVAKGALTTLTRSLARDYGKFNITANMVTPGSIWPEKNGPQPDELPKAYSEQVLYTPMGRIANTEDIAKACLFYASDLSSFITGTNLMVCGGMIMD